MSGWYFKLDDVSHSTSRRDSPVVRACFEISIVSKKMRFGLQNQAAISAAGYWRQDNRRVWVQGRPSSVGTSGQTFCLRRPTDNRDPCSPPSQAPLTRCIHTHLSIRHSPCHPATPCKFINRQQLRLYREVHQSFVNRRGHVLGKETAVAKTKA
jgi:hypothetical protein